MTGPPIDQEHKRIIALFHAGLVTGNRILHAGGGHPAPPAGEQVLFAEDL